MKLKLQKLEYSKSIEYLHEIINGLGYWGDLIIDGVDFQKGRFFTIVPDNCDVTRMYNFKEGGVLDSPKKSGIVPIPTLIQDLVLIFLYEYVNNNNDNCVIIENYEQEKSDKFISSQSVEYYQSGQTLTYRLHSGMDRLLLEKYYNLANSYYCMPILSNCDFSNVKLNIGRQTSVDILNNIKGILLSIYDKEGFLVWIADSGKGLYELLEKEINSDTSLPQDDLRQNKITDYP